MTVLLYTYTDWQCKIVPQLKTALEARGERLYWLGRRSPGVDTTTIRGVPPGNPFKRSKEFEAEGPLPTLDNPIEFERAYLSSYIYQMSRYAKGYGSRGHNIKYFHEYRDHFFLTARKFKRFLIREDITCLIFINMPHTADDYLLYRVAEDMGLKTVMFMVSPFTNRFFSTPSIEAYGVLDQRDREQDIPDIKLDSFDRQVKATVQSYMHGTYRAEKWKLREVLFAIGALARRSPGSFFSPGSLKDNVGEIIRLQRSLRKRRRTRRELLRGSQTRQFLDWLSILRRDAYSLPEKFVYFPLHFQPELTTAPQGGIFGDQALAIEMLSATLPEGIEIVVKENPMQGAYHREKSFASRLTQLDKVTVLHPSVSNNLLEEKCLAVAVVTGTAGWEAIRDGRPCICFGHAWYLNCPGIHTFDSHFSLETVLENPPTLAGSEAFLGKVLGRSHEGVVYEFFLNSDDPAVEEQNFKDLTATFVGLVFGEIQTTFGST